MAETGLISTWEDLACACGGTTFLQLMALRAKPGGGTTIGPAGWQCSVCGARADMATMQRERQRRHRLAELKALEAEIEATAPPDRGPGQAAAAPRATSSRPG